MFLTDANMCALVKGYANRNQPILLQIERWLQQLMPSRMAEATQNEHGSIMLTITTFLVVFVTPITYRYVRTQQTAGSYEELSAVS